MHINYCTLYFVEIGYVHKSGYKKKDKNKNKHIQNQKNEKTSCMSNDYVMNI